MKDTLAKILYRIVWWSLVLGCLLLINYGHQSDPLLWSWQNH